MLPSLPQQRRRRRKKLIQAARLLARGDLNLDELLGEATVPAESEIENALAMLGLYVEGGLTLADEEFWLWPENEQVFLLWMEVQTQWTVGPAGPIGLNYAGVDVCLVRGDIPRRDRNKAFKLVMLMERAALEEWASRRNT